LIGETRQEGRDQIDFRSMHEKIIGINGNHREPE
jgi:hypothetical protein